MQCHHTTHAIYQKFGMIHLMSRTGQCLLAQMSANVYQPITSILHGEEGPSPRQQTLTMNAPGIPRAKRLLDNFFTVTHGKMYLYSLFIVSISNVGSFKTKIWFSTKNIKIGSCLLYLKRIYQKLISYLKFHLKDIPSKKYTSKNIYFNILFLAHFR